MADDGVRLVKPGMKYEGAQGVTYDAGVSRNTVGAEKVCMNILPMPLVSNRNLTYTGALKQ